jgi:methanogenic corrinoid protein MtbC1
MADAEVRTLAGKAVYLLAQQARADDDAGLSPLDRLCDAFIAAEEAPRLDALTDLKRAGIGSRQIIDEIIPEVARIMGRRWGADEISFVHVTIGAARLQETVRALTYRAAHEAPASDRPTILIVLPRPEHHTLGAFVAADQFRRYGYAVDIAVDQHPRQIAQLLRRRRFAMIGITASGRRTLASTRELVDTLRATATRVAPIVIGGSVLEGDLDVRQLTGADYTARSALGALKKCGLPLVKVPPSPKLYEGCGVRVGPDCREDL